MISVSLESGDSTPALYHDADTAVLALMRATILLA